MPRVSRLTVNLPAGTTFVSSTQGTSNNGVVTAPLGTLAAGGQLVISIVVGATPAGSLDATAVVASASPDDLNASNNTSSTSVTSNAPITLSRTIEIDVGTISTPSYSGFPNVDAFSILGLTSTEVINAILSSPGLDARVAAGLTAVRDASPANPTTLAYFESTADQTATVFGTSVLKPASQDDDVKAFYAPVEDYARLVTRGSDSLTTLSDPGVPLSLSFPNLTDASTGQVRNGELTVNFFVRDVLIHGPIGTATQLVGSPNPVAPGQT